MKEKILGSIWFWWAITTIAYVLLFQFHNSPSALADILFMCARVIGLFVPFGLLSLFMFATPFGWTGLAVFVGTMIYANKKIAPSSFSLGKKILVIFVALFLITMATDLARGTPFGSFNILINGFDGFSL